MIQNEVNPVLIALILHVDSIPRVDEEISGSSRGGSLPYPPRLKPGGLRRASTGQPQDADGALRWATSGVLELTECDRTGSSSC